MSIKLIKEIKQSRDALLFLMDMGITELPLTPEVKSFLKWEGSQKENLDKSLARQDEKKKTSKIFPGLGKMVEGNNNSILEEITLDIKDCTRCALHQHRSAIVTGQGEKEARLFIIEEKPAEDEENTGVCIAGEAGDLLDKMLQAIGLDRSETYITSIVKCRPENDRHPTDTEINTCLPFLARQISAVKPSIIFALGPLAAKVMTGISQPLFRIRGKFHDFHGTPLMASFHPSFLLKNKEMKKASWIDLQMIQNKLAKKS